MADREKVLAVLRKRFPDAPIDEVAAAANAIVGLGAEWREVASFERDLLPYLTAECTDPTCLAARIRAGGEFMLLERVADEAGD